MVRIRKKIVQYRVAILVTSILLLIPSVLGYLKTRVNYDILYYLPDHIETMEGQDILKDNFGKGAFAMEVVEGMSTKEVTEVKKKIEKVDGVAEVIWYDSLMDTSLPISVLPDKLKDVFNTDDATLMAIFFEDTTSADSTMDAITEIRSVTNKQCYLSSMSAVVTDIKNLSEKETPIYVLIAVVLTCIVLSIFMDCWIIPVFFMLSIGMAILYNLGTNVFLGEISYITKALSAVLQLGVTLDYSIFLWHSYEEQRNELGRDKEEAMSHAVADTFVSITGSSLTTVAGFLALCFMTFTLGKDLGIVMAKGVIFGVLGCITILPSLILTFEPLIEKTRHKGIIPKFDKLSGLVTKKPGIFAVIFIVLMIPACFGYTHTSVYYNLDKSVPETLPFHIANDKLGEEFDMNTTHMLLVNADMDKKDVDSMMQDIDKIDGVKYTLGLESAVGPAVPDEIIPGNLENIVKSENYQLLIINSKYKVASDKVNDQIDSINKVVKKYDNNGMLIGEAPCTKDLISITDKDFKVVSAISIAVIFIIIAIVLKSISLPIILVAVIELAIFINMGIPYYTGTELPFIASICISTIQLGATVDYAILMTTRYKRERYEGKSKHEAVKTSMPSIMVSALGFFAATFGVGMYSDIDIISSLCDLMARGAIVSMLVVMFILPSMFMLFDKIICKTSKGFIDKGGAEPEMTGSVE